MTMASAVQVAYHEAGHAVACLASGVAFVSVTSIPATKNKGCIQLAPGQETHDDRSFAWVNGGGIIADRINRGRDDFTVNTIRNWHRYGWLESDIATLITEFPDKDQLLALIHSVADLTRIHWPAIEAIAAVLRQPTVLTSDDAQKLYLDAMGGRETGS